MISKLSTFALSAQMASAYYYGPDKYAANEDCSNFNGDVGCTSGQQTRYPDEWSARSFQTFLEKGPDSDQWKPEYEGLGRVMCFNKITYSDDLKSATVEAKCRQASQVSSLQYNFNDEGFQSDNTYKTDSGNSDTLTLTVKAITEDNEDYTITMDPLNFVWQANPVTQDDKYEGGQKGAIVEMFGWPYADIKDECEFLGKAGYMGVKVFPPQESIMTYEWPQNGELNPWFFLYQPTSYKLDGRHGTRDELRDMIQTCRAAGVRVYADAVVNHMTGGGNDVWDSHRNGNGGGCDYWGPKASSGGAPFFTQEFMYKNSNNTNLPPGLEFPGAAYIQTDFHCERSLNSWTDPFILNNGWLVGLSDLDTESEYVRERIAAYMTDLLSIGFSGFRVDAAKHIQPASLSAIFKKLADNMGGKLPGDFITYLEVIMGGEMQLLICNDGDYNFGKSFEDKMRAEGLSDEDIKKVKIWQSAYPKEFPECGQWQIDSERFVAENDCHDDQNPGSSSRDMGDKGSVLIKEKDVNKHRDFEKQLFTRTDGNWKIKTLLSSYTFMDNGAQGIPDGKSDCDKCVGDQCNSCTKSMKYSKAFDDSSCGYDCEKDGQWQEGVYTRVHRDQDIINAMRQWMGLSQESDPTLLGLSSTCAAKSQLKEEAEIKSQIKKDIFDLEEEFEKEEAELGRDVDEEEFDAYIDEAIEDGDDVMMDGEFKQLTIEDDSEDQVIIIEDGDDLEDLLEEVVEEI